MLSAVFLNVGVKALQLSIQQEERATDETENFVDHLNIGLVFAAAATVLLH